MKLKTLLLKILTLGFYRCSNVEQSNPLVQPQSPISVLPGRVRKPKKTDSQAQKKLDNINVKVQAAQGGSSGTAQTPSPEQIVAIAGPVRGLAVTNPF